MRTIRKDTSTVCVVTGAGVGVGVGIVAYCMKVLSLVRPLCSPPLSSFSLGAIDADT